MGAMKRRGALRAGIGIALCIVGFAMGRSTGYRETTVMVDAGGCHLATDAIDTGNDDVRGYVVLFHGLSANKKLMNYLAQGFASQNLRVFVPDLPGHGRTAGPFSFARAESCADELVRELAARRAIDLQRTILAGHSMGGAIAIRVAARAGVAGVVAISPAPQRAAHGLPATMLPYKDPPALPAHTLAITGEFEPLGIRDSARDLVTAEGATSKFLLIPRATHVSVLYDGRVARAAEEWSAATLKFAAEPYTPSVRALVGSLAGLAGILLLAGPFIRETLGTPGTGQGSSKAAALDAANAATAVTAVGTFQALVEMTVISFAVVALLRYWSPLEFVRMYNGGYFGGFLLLAGTALLLLHRNWLRGLWPTPWKALLTASVAGLVMHLLVTAWLNTTASEAWVSWGRWAWFPVLLVGAFAYLLAEEGLLGTVESRSKLARLWLALTLRAIAFVALLFGIFVLHSGAILILLLALYLAIFLFFQRLGMDLVGRTTGSPIAAALFGAILLAGFCLVIFPIT
jgi:pimeloyl-ACP methyl ester carboxylesterase